MNNKNFAKVALVKDAFNAVINKGSFDGVSVNDEFVIYRVGQEIIDPESGESLGALEEILAKVKVTHVQEKISTVISNEFIKLPNKTEIKKIVKNSNAGMWGVITGDGAQEITTTTPGELEMKTLDFIKVGDSVGKTL